MDAMTKHQLKELTDAYWRKVWSEEDQTKMEWYVSKLLPHELKYAEEHATLRKKKCDLLVIMLGLSFEPLLQSIEAYQPQKILMVVNHKYNHEEDGEIDGKTYFRDCFLPVLTLLDEAPTVLPAPMKIAGDDPISVFRFLRQELLPLLGSEGKRNDLQVVIDITGAKKSMVAGAYIFAAFADVPVSYVDFDEYNPKEGKPYGYTCRIGELDSPTQKFRLRDWSRLEQLYKRDAFRGARELLERELIPALKNWFAPEETKAASSLSDVLRMYELWDNGDYKSALDKYNQVKDSLADVPALRLPTAIEVLGEGNHWPHVSDGESAGNAASHLTKQVGNLQFDGTDMSNSLYLQTDRLLVYAHDEIAKVKRLIDKNEDYRSALLRSAGLHEVLCRARVLILLKRGWLSVSPSKPTEQGNAKVLIALDMNRVREILEGQPSITTQARLTIRRSNADPQIPRPIPNWIFDGLTADRLPKLRSRAIHFCLPVTKALADTACDITFENLKEFREQWASLGTSPKVTSDFFRRPVDWQQLCKACGIDFLPPQ